MKDYENYEDYEDYEDGRGSFALRTVAVLELKTNKDPNLDRRICNPRSAFEF